MAPRRLVAPPAGRNPLLADGRVAPVLDHGALRAPRATAGAERARGHAQHLPPRQQVERQRTINRAPAASAASLARAISRGRYFIPQSGAATRRSGGTSASAAS